MSSWGSFDFSEFKDFQEKINKLCQEELDTFCRDCAKELAARLLGKVIRRTPVGDYSKTVVSVARKDGKKHKKGETYTRKVSTGKKGGTLRRGWTGGEKVDGGAVAYAHSLPIIKQGKYYTVEVTNPTEYASYVEYGHRTRNGGGCGWVEGRFMLFFSENELRLQAPKILERKLNALLRQVFS